MAKDKSAELTEEAYARAEAALESAEAALKQAHEAVEDGLDEAHLYLKRQWRERPLTVAGAALGAGLVIGLLIGSRR